ncbi:hypothetical protein Tco_1197391, partial [Tanacetum coccineum]
MKTSNHFPWKEYWIRAKEVPGLDPDCGLAQKEGQKQLGQRSFMVKNKVNFQAFQEAKMEEIDHISVFLSDHRPILLRESAHDYGPVPFRFFHHWIHLEGFNDFVTSTWNSAPSVDSNGMRNLAGKLKFLKAHIKIWIKDNKSETVSTIANLKKELNQLDAVIDKGTCTEVEAEKRMEVLAALR